MSKKDMVNQPPHYTQYSVECIDIMERFSSVCLANAFKYVWRAGLKADAIEDLDKAVFYVTRFMEGKHNPPSQKPEVALALVLKVNDIENMDSDKKKLLCELLGLDAHGYMSILSTTVIANIKKYKEKLTSELSFDTTQNPF